MSASRSLRPAADETARKERSHSGRLLLRMPETLHADLARAADQAGVSLNQFITSALGAVVGDKRATDSRGASSSERGRWLPILFAVNLVVVATAGVIAILLLVSSWRG